MKIDFTTIIKTKNDEETLTRIAIQALDLVHPTKEKDHKTKLQQAKLAVKLEDLDEKDDKETLKNLEIKNNEVTLLKDLIGAYFFPKVVLQAWEILDPKEAEEA